MLDAFILHENIYLLHLYLQGDLSMSLVILSLLFSLFIILTFAILLLIEVVKGLKHNFFQNLVSLGNIFVSIIFSAVLSPQIAFGISKMTIGFLPVKRICNFFKFNYNDGRSLVEGFATMIISIILFLALFTIFRAIISLVSFVILKKSNRGKKSIKFFTRDTWFERNDKILSVITSTLCAILLTMVITMPVMGVVDVCRQGINMIETFQPDFFERRPNMKPLINTFECVENNIPGNVFYHCGGKFIFESVTVCYINGEKVYLAKELDALTDVVDDLASALTAIQNPAIATAEQLEAIDSLCISINDMRMSTVVVANYISAGSRAWLQGKTIFGYGKPKLNEFFTPIMDDTLLVCGNTTVNNAKQNIITLLKLYKVFMLQKDLLQLDASDNQAILTVATYTNFAGELEKHFHENAYMEHLAIKPSQMVFSAFAKRIDLLDDKSHTLMVNLADAISTAKEREYNSADEEIAYISYSVERHVKNYGINIDSTIAEAISKTMIAHFYEHKAPIDSVMIQELFESYK